MSWQSCASLCFALLGLERRLQRSLCLEELLLWHKTILPGGTASTQALRKRRAEAAGNQEVSKYIPCCNRLSGASKAIQQASEALGSRAGLPRVTILLKPRAFFHALRYSNFGFTSRSCLPWLQVTGRRCPLTSFRVRPLRLIAYWSVEIAGSWVEGFAKSASSNSRRPKGSQKKSMKNELNDKNGIAWHCQVLNEPITTRRP